MLIRPRRSVLFMPATNARAIDKARTLPVDGVILDLEDAVAPDAKAQARQAAAAAVRAGGFGHREVFIRINALGTEWAIDDLAAAVQAKPDAIVLPKVDRAGALTDIAELLIDLRADPRIRIWAMLESPAAVLHAEAIAASSRDPETRLAGFIAGTNDMAKESGLRIVPGRAPLVPWLMTCVAAARAYGLAILDGVFNDIADGEGLAAECRQGRDMGFDGKTLIHPSQIAACNEAFSPAAEDVAQARKIIAAFDLPENQGKGVVALDGRMVERMHAEMARRTVAIAEAIAARQ